MSAIKRHKVVTQTRGKGAVEAHTKRGQGFKKRVGSEAKMDEQRLLNESEGEVNTEGSVSDIGDEKARQRGFLAWKRSWVGLLKDDGWRFGIEFGLG